MAGSHSLPCHKLGSELSFQGPADGQRLRNKARTENAAWAWHCTDGHFTFPVSIPFQEVHDDSGGQPQRPDAAVRQHLCSVQLVNTPPGRSANAAPELLKPHLQLSCTFLDFSSESSSSSVMYLLWRGPSLSRIWLEIYFCSQSLNTAYPWMSSKLTVFKEYSPHCNWTSAQQKANGRESSDGVPVHDKRKSKPSGTQIKPN